MEENLHQDNLEDFFRKSLQEESTESSESGWDQPSAEVWDGIAESLEEPTIAAAPRLPRIWLTIAASLLAIVMIYYVYTCNTQLGYLNAQVEEQSRVIESLERNVSQNQSQEKTLPTGPSKDQLPTERPFDTSFMAKSSIATAETTATTTNETNNAISQENTLNGTANKTKLTPPITEQRPQNILTENKKTNTSPAQKTSPENKLAQETSPITRTKEEQNIDPATTPILSAKDAEVMRVALLDPMAKQAIVATAQPYEIGRMPLPKLKESQSKTTFRNGFYAGLFVGPTSTYRNLQAPDRPTARRLLNSQEKADYSYNLGLKLGYRLGKHWSVETGAQYLRATIRSRQRAQLRYSALRERLNGDGDFESSYEVSLPTSFGTVETDVALTRSSGTSIAENDFINMFFQTRQRLQMVRVPLIAAYHFGQGPWDLQLRAGLSATFVVDQEAEIRAVSSLRNGVRHRSTKIQREFDGLNTFSTDYLLGFGIAYHVSERWRLFLEPTFTKSIRPLYEMDQIETYPLVAAVNIGMSYQF